MASRPVNDESKSQRRHKRSRVEKMLWDWVEETEKATEVTGFPATSPTHRLMKKAQPNGRSVSSVAGWHGRIVGAGRRRRSVKVEHGQTVFAKESPIRKLDAPTQPELDADQMGPPDGLIMDVLLAMPDYQRQIIIYKFYERVRDFKEIARLLEMNKDAVSTLYKQALDHLHRVIFEVPSEREDVESESA